MRLINVHTGQLEEPKGPPPYAILSHTWGDSEVSFRDLNHPDVESRPQYAKIRHSRRLAASRNLDYVWIDTCCIDKSSSAELSEAINSMFEWYKNAEVCFAHIEDLPSGGDTCTEGELGRCRWFTRGWTLQELIAPKEVRFYDQNWEDRGTKQSLRDMVSHVTGIRKDILLGAARLDDISVSERMSWAAHRNTTRREDIAYSLLGIFDVNMPLIYGEGGKAFIRLQEEIIKRTNDLSLFAWDARDITEPYCGILADSPARFHDSSRELSRISWAQSVSDFAMTNNGLRMTVQLWVPYQPQRCQTSFPGYFLCLNQWRQNGHQYRRDRAVGLFLAKVGRGRFVRISHTSLTPRLGEPQLSDEKYKLQTIYIAASYWPRTAALGVCESARIQVHFRLPEIFNITCVAPSASWDAFNRLFFFDSGVSGCSGIACVSGVIEDEGGKGKIFIRFGVTLEENSTLTGLRWVCWMFKWDSDDLDAFFQENPAILTRDVWAARAPVLPFRRGRVECLFYDLWSYKLRISVSISEHVMPSISSEPIPTIIIEASTWKPTLSETEEWTPIC
ncbi:HET-domain-containing protein [Canariomyces notabilis]|uniref:HET-domain-containing protein n=1 Tax=Canariomyces notabilis TaxID=2074819 RepID=A0AAN6YSU8_9PEZI|nr:HET-domain-containing protein [Canariomyces arenarius]